MMGCREMGLLSIGCVSTFVSKEGGRGIFLAGDQCAIPGNKKLRLAGLKKSKHKNGRKEGRLAKKGLLGKKADTRGL